MGTTTLIRSKLELGLRKLPVLPQAVVALMCMDAEDDDFFDRLMGVVEPEPNFSARILALANSSARTRGRA